MSKAAWKTFFGLKLSRWAGRDPARRALPADCDTVLTGSALREAGVKHVTRARLKLERDPRFHHKVVIFPDGRRGKTTATNSFTWLLGVQHDEDRDRSRANLMVGGKVLETIVAPQQGSGAPFVPEIWRVPVAPQGLRTDAPLLPEARPRSSLERPGRQDDRVAAVVRDDRELDSALLDLLYSEALRLITATDATLPRGDLAAELGLEHSKEDRLALAKVLHRLKTEGYHVAP
jgi:hypothetical protein